VFFLRKPNRSTLARLLSSDQSNTFSYEAVGSTQRDAPGGYRIDHNRILIGHGLDQFEAAKVAIDEWKMFDLPWFRLFPARPAIRVGAAVAVTVRHLGFWSVNISRIVYVVN
jgi:uncharacterized protein (UPF0548 family)